MFPTTKRGLCIQVNYASALFCLYKTFICIACRSEDPILVVYQTCWKTCDPIHIPYSRGHKHSAYKYEFFIQLLAESQRCIKQPSFNHSLILHCTQCPDSAVTTICKQKSPPFALYFYAFLRMWNTYRNEPSNVGMLGLSA